MLGMDQGFLQRSFLLHCLVSKHEFLDNLVLVHILELGDQIAYIQVWRESQLKTLLCLRERELILIRTGLTIGGVHVF